VFYPNAARSQAALQPVPRWVERLSRHVRCPYGQRPGRPEVRCRSAVSARRGVARARSAAGPAGPGVSLRQNALDPGFHGVPTRSAHLDREADGVGVTW